MLDSSSIHYHKVRINEELNRNVPLVACDCRHWGILAAQAAELGPMPLMTAADVVMVSDEAGKHNLANTFNISESVDSISTYDPPPP